MVLLSAGPEDDEATDPLVGARGMLASPSAFRLGVEACLFMSLWPSDVPESNHGALSDRDPASSPWFVAVQTFRSSPSLPRPPARKRLVFGPPRNLCKPSPMASSSLASSRRLSRQEGAEALSLPPRTGPLALSPPSSRAPLSSPRPSACEPRSSLELSAGDPAVLLRSFQGGARSLRAASSSASGRAASEHRVLRRPVDSRLLPPSDRTWSLSFCSGAGICCFAPSIAAQSAVVCLMSVCGEKKVYTWVLLSARLKILYR
mmetsp:Transcript_22757/g.52085  ORF Transcript_22757/g.52085 Transcript_22757/m.52085 type:complete len:261 (+) Transcript_22757:271-1053(+)